VRRGLVGLALVLVAVATAIALGVNRTQASVAASQRVLCGVERWKVKTLQDRPHLLALKTKTIAWLASQPKPKPLPSTRLPFEYHQYRVVAQVTKVLTEDDDDLHLVLFQGTDHMIAEAPSAACNMGATAYRRNQMKMARSAVKVCAKAEIIGVAFFDFFHHQTGVAPNEIELHPILKFNCLSA
jgi:hypothetical protein